MENIEKLANLGGTVTTVVIFIWYLKGQGAIFNETINNHLKHSTRVIEENNKINSKIQVTLRELCLTLKNGNGKKKR